LFNKRADKLAKASANGEALRGPLDSRKVRRKKTTEKVQRGIVEMLGQQMTVRLFEELDQSDQGWSASSTRSSRNEARTSTRSTTSGPTAARHCA
jgi:hypothetical protein